MEKGHLDGIYGLNGWGIYDLNTWGSYGKVSCMLKKTLVFRGVAIVYSVVGLLCIIRPLQFNFMFLGSSGSIFPKSQKKNLK